MPENKNIIKTVVEWLVNKPSLNKAKKGFDDIKKKNDEINELNRRNLQSLKGLGDEFQRLGKQGSDALSKIGTEYKDILTKDEQLKKRLQDRDDQFQRLSNQVGLGGDAQSNLGSIQGLLGSAGATGAQQGVSNIGELFALTEELPRLKASLQGMPDVVRASASALGLSTAEFVGAGVASAALAATLKLVSDASAIAETQMKSEIEARRLYLETLQSGTVEGATQSLEEVQSKLAIEQALLAENTAKLDAKFAGFSAGGLNDLGARLNFLTSEIGINDGAIKALAESVSTSNDKITELREQERALILAREELEKRTKTLEEVEAELAKERLKQTNAVLDSAKDTADRTRFVNETTKNSIEQNILLSQKLADEAQAITDEINQLKASGDTSDLVSERLVILQGNLNDIAVKTELLNRVSIPWTRQIKEASDAMEASEKASKESSKEAEKSAREREQVLSRINRLAEQADSTIARFAERQADFTRQQDQRLQDFDIKRLQDEQDHNRKLLDISRQGTGRIEKLNQSISDSENDYFNSRIKAVRDYADELEQLDDQRNLERIQRERANADDLNELEFENDVIGFLRAERRQAEERRKTNENAKLEDKQRAEQFNKQLADDQQAFIQRRALIQRQIAEEQRAIQQRVQAEREAFQLQTQRNQQAFDLERQRAIETLNLERQKTQQQLALIQQKAQLEANAVQGTISQIRLLQNAVNQLASSVSQFSGSTRTSSSSSNSNSYQARLAQIQAQNKARSSGDFQQVVRLGGVYASGGIVRGGRPSLNILGDTPRGIDEAVIPFKRSEGIRPALQRAGLGGGMPAIHLNITANVGENASIPEVKAMIKTAVNESKVEIVRGVASGISAARFNPQ